jgi:hypothetical protein
MVLLAGGAAMADVPDSTFSFGLWVGGAAMDAKGAFTHCYATLHYTMGEQIWVNIVGPDRLELIFTFPGLTFKPGQEIEASLMMESGSPTPGKAVGLDEKHVFFAMAPLNEAHVFLSQGRWLRIMGLGRDDALEVPGLGGAIGLVRQCHDKYGT